ncbi:MAG TPA: sensor domain-containing diguanylate cyclase [Burkholderiaceae bacterium]
MNQDTEAARLQKLRALGVLDIDVDEELRVLVRAAAAITGAPKAFVTFVEDVQVRLQGQDSAPARMGARENSFCSLAIKEDEILFAEDVRTDSRTAAVAARPANAAVVTYAGAVLKTEDGINIGTLCVLDHVKRSLTQEQLQLLVGLARQVMHLVALRKTTRELDDALAKMTLLATTDGLTGLLNRRAFFERAEQLQKLAGREGGQISVALIDVDHFKKVNDNFGHAAGDQVLVQLAQRLRTKLRGTDLIGRIGGEEFAIALPFTALDAALAVTEQLRLQVAAAPVAFEGQDIPVTISAGVTSVAPGGDSVEGALRNADAALYRAKAEGRNRVTAA